MNRLRLRPTHEPLRFTVSRHRAMRVALRAAGLLVIGSALLTGISFLLLGTAEGRVVCMLNLVQAAGGFAVTLAVRGRARRSPELLAYVFLAACVIVPLVTIAVQPDRFFLVGASLTLIPGLVALFIPFTPAMYAAWVAIFSATIVAAGSWIVAAGVLPATGILELFAICAIGVGFGVVGQRLRYRGDRVAFERDNMRRVLAHESTVHAAALKALNDDLARIVRTDFLTGAGNRNRLNEDLAAVEARLRRYRHGLAFVLIDVDRFKLYNDQYGHVAGDAALRLVATRLMEATRSTDTVYRFGGEELAILLPDQAEDGGLAAAERLRMAVLEAGIPHAGNPPWGVVTVSVGIVVVPSGATSGQDDWIRQADQALYEAKASGRNRCVLAIDETTA